MVQPLTGSTILPAIDTLPSPAGSVSLPISPQLGELDRANKGAIIGAMGGNVARSGVSTAPTRQSPRKPSNNTTAPAAAGLPHPPANRMLPTPLSNSPSASSSYTLATRYPPQFDASHPLHHYPAPSLSQRPPAPPSLSASRISTALYTPRSPYRPGEYGYNRRVDQRADAASERTRIERRLFEDDREDEDMDAEREREMEQELEPKRNRGSSPLQPAFEARLILRKGAPVDLISWLRRNFHHIPSPSHPSLTCSTSLLAIRALLAERFPRLPEPDELVKAVMAAFPRVHMDHAPKNSSEPPMVRGLVWNGKETVYEEEREREKDRRVSLDIAMGRTGAGAGVNTPDRKIRRKTDHLPPVNTAGGLYAARQVDGSGIALPLAADGGSRSPTQDTLVSPTSSAARKLAPNTPARSVLEEFAVLATLAEKTPAPAKAHSLPDGGEIRVPAPAYALASICNSFDATPPKASSVGGKRKASTSTPEPDRLEGLLAAAEKIEGSPMTSFLDTSAEQRAAGSAHKRRRTIGGVGSMREVLEGQAGALRRSRGSFGEGTTGPRGSGIGMGLGMGQGWLPRVKESHQETGSVSDAEEAVAPGIVGADAGSAAALMSTAVSVSGVGTKGSKTKGKSRASGASGSASGSRGKARSGVKSRTAKPPATPSNMVVPSLPESAGMAIATVPVQRSHTNSTASQASASAVSSLLAADLEAHSSPLVSMQYRHSFAPNPAITTAPYPSASASASASPSRPRKANELPTEGLYPGIDCKPPHPYHEMIRHAIEAAPDRRLQLSQIYASIAERFPFFGALDEKKTAGWQNSIRHNLSLKKMFVRVNKVDGVPDEGGKGGWWTVEPGIPDEGRPGRKSKSTPSISGVITAPAPAPALALSVGPTKGRKSDGDVSAVSGMIDPALERLGRAYAGDEKRGGGGEWGGVVKEVGDEKYGLGLGLEYAPAQQ